MQNEISQALDARNASIDAAKAFFAEHRREDGTMTPEDAATFRAMADKAEQQNNYLDTLTRFNTMTDNAMRPVSTPLTSAPVSGAMKTGRASDEYKQAMLQAFRTNFRQISNTLTEGTAADGGYLVPVEYDERLIEKLKAENIFRQLATTVTTSGQYKINIATSDAAAAWIDEGDPLQFSDPHFGQIILDAHKLHVAVKVSEELLYDNAFNLENYIIEQFGKALANAEEDAFLNGNGSGKPTGIFDATDGGTAAVSTAAIKADDIVDLVYALKRPYRKNACFIMNDALVASVRKLKDLNQAYIWQPAMVAGEPDKLLGYDVYTSAYAPNDKIAFGDFSYYQIGDRGIRSFKQLNELFAGNGLIGFVAKERVDGKLAQAEAVQILTKTA